VAKQQLQSLREYFASVLEDGVDYAVIPGTKKPSLLKPGAETLAMALNAAPDFELTERQIDWEAERAYLEFRCVLRSRSSGKVMGAGVGAVTTEEKRYKYQKDGKRVKDPLKNLNTLLKIGKKRAFVDAVLTVTGASRFFTQDLEDMPKGEVSNGTPPAARPAVNGKDVACVKCGDGIMERRVRRADGGVFYGCTNFPQCKQTLDASEYEALVSNMAKEATSKEPEPEIAEPVLEPWERQGAAGTTAWQQVWRQTAETLGIASSVVEELAKDKCECDDIDKLSTSYRRRLMEMLEESAGGGDPFAEQ